MQMILKKCIQIAKGLDQYINDTNPLKNYKKFITYPPKGSIAIHNVCFSYASLPEQKVIKNINISIYPKETIVILGPSGSGKSTLLNLLMGFYNPISGNIYLDGIKINDLNPKELRKSISLVGQESEFFTASIYENIMYGNPYAPDDQVYQLIELFLPNNWIASFPKGLSTIIGPRGYGLSIGQKQCIALLRILLRNPSCLLLDEATSGIDYESDNHIMKNLKPYIKERTTIMVTHKISHILIADRIILMNKGQVIAFGTHNQLYKENMFYKKLIMSELEGESYAKRKA